MVGVGRPKFAAWMEPFRHGFTNPTWQHVLVLIAGAILSPGRRTVAAALRVTGLDIPYPAPKLEEYHLPSVDRILDAIARLQWDDEVVVGGGRGA